MWIHIDRFSVTDQTCYSPEARHKSNCPVLTDKFGYHRESAQHQWRMKTWRDSIWNSFENTGGGVKMYYFIFFSEAKVFIGGRWTDGTVIENFINTEHLGENLANLHIYFTFSFPRQVD